MDESAQPRRNKLSSRAALRLIAALFLMIVTLSCGISLFWPHRSNAVAEEARVLRALSKYKEDGLLALSLLDKYKFAIPRHLFYYSAGVSPDQMLDQITPQISKDPASDVAFYDFKSDVIAIGQIFLAQSAYKKVTINSDPLPDAVNIYVLQKDPLHVTHSFSDNCEYIGYANAIICDVDLFRSEFQKIEAYDRGYDIDITDVKTRQKLDWSSDGAKQVKMAIRQALVVWIIGHEIGHAVLHKGIVLDNAEPLHFSLEYNIHEKQADAFVSEKMAGSKPLAGQFVTTAGEFVQHQFREIYLKTHEDSKTINENKFILNNKIHVKYSRYEVPLILRAVRIVNSILNDHPDIDGTGYFRKIEDNITIDEEFSFVRKYFYLVLVLMIVSAAVIVVGEVRSKPRRRM